MNQQSNITMPRLFSTIIYICGLFLFLEWLYPIRDITETDSISMFIIYAVFCFFIAVLQLTWWINFLLKGFGLLFILNILYFDMQLFSLSWIETLYAETLMNLDFLFRQEWYYLTPLFRSILFLILIWLMSYLLYYWFVQMKRTFLFIVMTFSYIALLDTFTLYEGTFPIIRIFIVSLIAFSMVNLSRHLERENLSFQWVKKAPSWLMPIFTILAIAVVIGIISPKYEPQWPDPVPFIHSAAQSVGGSGGNTVQKVGYGEDDTSLGGSFIQDNTPVFYAETYEKHYWRIETKDVYTGKGWETSADRDAVQQPAYQIGLETFHNNVETEKLSADITFEEGQTINKLVYPYGVERLNIDVHGAEYYLEHVTEAIEVRVNGAAVESKNYQLTYNYPSFNIQTLQNSTEAYHNMERFTKLPESLPERVTELAAEITKPFDNRYDKVRAIERYFVSNDFAYQTTGVAVPGENEDYVEQFLFETKVGYCDNYSTAMVVMLRTLDIPARWVKGFTAGEVIQSGNGTTFDTYEITNANAHSWVEVYFPEAGWVPFEPTQGFSNLTEFHVESEGVDAMQGEDLLEVPIPELEELEREEQNIPEKEESEPAFAEMNAGKLQMNWWFIVAGLGILLSFIYILYKQRYKIRTKMCVVKLERKQSAKAFEDAYLHLLRVLNRSGYRREPYQTLREFAKWVDARYDTYDMSTLTDYYERILYRNEFNKEELTKLTGRWKQLMNRIMG